MPKKKYSTPAKCFYNSTVRRETELENELRRKDQLPDAREIYVMLRGKWGKNYSGMHKGKIKDLS